MSKIQVLDQITIDKIAAGEVIERPSSIVKELVENAIDAGATAVVVEIKEGGISFIRITDNGSGIEREDIRYAFLRHSTSKIRSVDDLIHISSLGFRGEALSSIAAVAQVELITKTKEDTFGSRYMMEGGQEKSLEDTGAPDGTTFLVRQLFYNTPARRKFLKTPMTEASHISELLTRLALSHPEVSLQFINNGQPKLHTSGNGNLKDVIYHIYGRDVANNLIELNFNRNGIDISGFLGKPTISRGNRNFENYFINGRYVKSNVISKSIEDAYKDFTMQHRYPFVVLHFQLSGETIDVNVHPTKMELRFSNQQEIYNLVYEAVHQGLHERELISKVEVPDPPKVSVATSAPSAKTAAPATFETTGCNQGISDTAINQAPNRFSENTVYKPVIAKHAAGLPEQEKAEPVADDRPKDLDYFMSKMRERVMTYHNRTAEKTSFPVKPETKTPANTVSGIAARSDDDTLEDSNPVVKEEQLNLFEEHLLSKDKKAEYQLIGQAFDTYWIVQFQEDLYIIDQHAAHERVLYERTLKGMKTREFTSQYLSPPIVLNLSMQEEDTLKTYLDQFTRIGFEIEPFGSDTYAVRAIPDNLFGIAKKELLLEMLDQLADGIHSNLAPDIVDEKIASMSCKAAVKGNSKLSAQEVDVLIGELLELDNPYHCPHGRPTIIAMTKRELEKKFKRIV